MCIKFASYLNQKRANWALNMLIFLLTKFILNSIFRCCSSGTKYDTNLSQKVPKKCLTAENWCKYGAIKVLAPKCTND